MGPGTELKKMLALIDIHPSADCPCIEHMLLMDEWGPEECQNRLAEIVGWLEAGYQQWGWRAILLHAVKYFAQGSPFPITFPGMVNEAIRRSRAAG